MMVQLLLEYPEDRDLQQQLQEAFSYRTAQMAVITDVWLQLSAWMVRVQFTPTRLSGRYRIIGTDCAMMRQRISPLQPGRDMSSSRRYITNEQGERIGVLLDLDEYRQMTRQLLRPDVSDPEVLIGLSESELQALAHSTLAPAEQSRLDHLLTQNMETQLSEAEQAELDRLLNDIDHLTILKTRARYTLAHQTGMLHTS